MPILSALYLYPIKSLGAIAVTEAVLEDRGFRHDRRFMLVEFDGKSESGKFMTQRDTPQMALIDVAIDHDTLRVWHRSRPTDGLVLPLTVAPEASGATLPLTNRDSVDQPAQPVSDRADRWFSTALGRPCRLVFMPDTTHRTVDPAYARHHDSVSFADGYPYLLIGQASVDDLNQRLPEPIDLLRFRPNIVVSGSTPYDEDAWSHFQIDGLNLYGVKPCARCVMTTIDPATGRPGKEPLRTLATYRRWEHKILFGQNVLVDPGTTGVLRVGQPLTVLNRTQPWLAPPVPSGQGV